MRVARPRKTGRTPRRTGRACRRARPGARRSGVGRGRRCRATSGPTACRRRGRRRARPLRTFAARDGGAFGVGQRGGVANVQQSGGAFILRSQVPVRLAHRSDMPASSRSARARTAGCASGRGCSIVAPAARACPPPPNAPVSRVASTPPSRVRTEMRVRSPWSLKRIDDLGALRLREQVDEALGHLDLGSGRRDVGVREHRPDDASVRRGFEAREHAAEEAQLRVRLGAIDAPRDERQVGAPAASSSLRHAQRARRRVGMLEVRRVDDEARPQVRGDGTIEGSRCRRPGAGSRSATISHVAAASASTQSTAPKPVFETWWSMSTMGTRANSSACSVSTRADALELAAVADDDEVGVEVCARAPAGSVRSGA